MQSTQIKHAIAAEEALQIAQEAYIYFYPLITMDVSRKVCTNVPLGSRPGFGPMNLFSHMRAYPDADFKTVVRPNFDTLYSVAWLDLTVEPMVITVPDTNGRYYLLPMLDMWTDVFASPGWRTSGTTAKTYVLAPKSWKGTLPADTELITATTPYTWVIGRTKTDGPEDYPQVHKIQDGFKLTPLSQWGKAPVPVQAKIDVTVDMKTPPLEQVNALSGTAFFTYAAELLKLHPPHDTDWSIFARMQRIGIEAGKSFDVSKIEPEIKEAIDQGASNALKFMVGQLQNLGRETNGWRMMTDSVGVYGNFYLRRAIISLGGLGANQVEDAVYPLNTKDADGKPLDGNNDYVLHFDSDKLPPVDAFWSVTMYDKNGFQAANTINRFAISSWMPLKKNSDGSLDIYMQNANPGADKESNWLPAPKTELGVTLRLYAPKPSVLTGDWNPPAVKLIK